MTPEEDLRADVIDPGFSHSPQPGRKDSEWAGLKIKELGNIRNDTLDRYDAYQKEAAFDQKRIGFLPLRVSPIIILP